MFFEIIFHTQNIILLKNFKISKFKIICFFNIINRIFHRQNDDRVISKNIF